MGLPTDMTSVFSSGTGRNVFASASKLPRPSRREWLVIAPLAGFALLFLPVVVWKNVVQGHGDVEVFFRAGWAIWSGYPLYEVTDAHG